jgi:hypothetical protein
MTDQDTIVERINKLLAKAERTDNSEEAEAFFSKAAALQSKHAIDEIMLNAAAGNKRDDIITKEYPLSGSYAKAHILMLHVLSKPLNCKVIQYKRGTKITAKVHGFRSDIERLDILFSSVLIQAARQLKPWAKEHTHAGMTAAEKYQRRKSYLIGFGEGAAKKLQESMTTAVEEAKEPGVGLVLVDRKQQVEDSCRDTFGRLGRARATKTDYAAVGHGQRAGRNADVGSSRVGPGNARALGR